MHGGFTGAADQLRLIVLDDGADAVRLDGPVGGTESHDAAPEVCVLAFVEAADGPYRSTASTA